MKGIEQIVRENAGAVANHREKDRLVGTTGAPVGGSRTRKAQTYTNPRTGARVTVQEPRRGA